MTDEEERIDPKIVELKLLSDISLKLNNVTEEMSKVKDINMRMIEEGIIEPLSLITATTTKRVVHPPYREKLWFGVKITNDGPSNIWVMVNTGKSNKPHELMNGETWGVQFKTAVIEDILLYTEGGSATVRVRGER